MVERSTVAQQFFTAWAEYERDMDRYAQLAEQAATGDPSLHQAIGTLRNATMGSQELRREIAMRLAFSEISK